MFTAVVQKIVILLCLQNVFCKLADIASKDCNHPGTECNSDGDCCSNHCVFATCACGPQCVTAVDCCNSGNCTNGKCECSKLYGNLMYLYRFYLTKSSYTTTVGPLPGDKCVKGSCCPNSGCILLVNLCSAICALDPGCQHMKATCDHYAKQYHVGLKPCCNRNGICSCGYNAYCTT